MPNKIFYSILCAFKEYKTRKIFMPSQCNILFKHLWWGLVIKSLSNRYYMNKNFFSPMQINSNSSTCIGTILQISQPIFFLQNWCSKYFTCLHYQKNTPDSSIWASSWQNLSYANANNKSANQPMHPRSLISTFVVHCWDNTVSVVATYKISRL